MLGDTKHGVRSVALRINKDPSHIVTKDEMKKLALDGIAKATPVIKDVVRQLMDEYMQQIQEITGEAIMEMANDEIQKMIKEQR